MKIAYLALLICSLSLPIASPARPHYYKQKPLVAVTYCNCYNTVCPYCYPAHPAYYDYGYYCDYCHDYGCPECDKAIAKIVLIGAIITGVAYLVDSILHS